MEQNIRMLWALLFLQGALAGMDIFSAVDSSPWTVETAIGGDPVKEAAQHRYIRYAVAGSMGAGLGASLISGNWWAVVGAGTTSAFMYWLYQDAIKRGQANGSKGWSL